MPCVHEFGILDELDKQKEYIDYEPQKYNCISVDDDMINNLNNDLSVMKTYYHSFDRPDLGLAYYGVTIIPHESLSFFYQVVTYSEKFKESIELHALASKIMQAIEEKKYMIHFGI